MTAFRKATDLQPLRVLFWLKWVLMLRGYRRSPSAWIGALAMLGILLPITLGIAAFCALGYLVLAPPLNGHALRAALLSIYAFWVMMPLLGHALGESYDITRLFVYPLTMRQIVTGAIVGSLLDLPTLFLLPALLAVFVGFTHDLPSFLVIFAATGLFLFHTLALSQAVLLAGSGLLQNRRFRDAAILGVSLLWIVYYVSTQALMGTGQGRHVNILRLTRAPLWSAVSWLPPGWAARAVIASESGDYALALACLLALAAATVATIWAASWFVGKVYRGETIFRDRAGRERGVSVPTAVIPDPQSAPPAFLRLTLPPVLQAVLDKETRYLWRDPYFKIALSNLVYVLFVGVFAILRLRRDAHLEILGSGLIWVMTGGVLLTEMHLVCNLFGTEGGAAALLFQTPAPRRQILMGKNLTLFTALSLINLVAITVLSAAAEALGWFGLLFCWMEIALTVFIALGNLVSIYFPYRMAMRGWRVRQASASRGCGYAFIYLSVMLVALVLLLPVLAGLILPMFWFTTRWLALTVPLSVLYAALLYALSLRIAAPLLRQRELDIIARVASEE